jgi:hypothetical protein
MKEQNKNLQLLDKVREKTGGEEIEDKKDLEDNLKAAAMQVAPPLNPNGNSNPFAQKFFGAKKDDEKEKKEI